MAMMALCPYSLWAQTQPGKGDGSESNPYQITSAQEMLWFANQVNSGSVSICGKLMNDIDLIGVISNIYNYEAGWRPIGNVEGSRYKGTFDGNGCKVSSMNIYNLDGDVIGFFGYSNGTIKNLWVSGNVTGRNEAALVVARTINGAIENCHSSGIVYADAYKAGGIAAVAEYSTVTNCTNSANITCQNTYVGGIAGSAKVSFVSNCTNTGAITNKIARYESYGSGGIVGLAIENSGINNCINKGTVTASAENAGGIVGAISNSSCNNSLSLGNVSGKVSGIIAGYANASFSNNYYLSPEKTLVGDNFNTKQEGIATMVEADQIKSGEVCYMLNGDQTDIVWYQTIGVDDEPVYSSEGHKQVYAQKECTGKIVGVSNTDFGSQSFVHSSTSTFVHYPAVEPKCEELGNIEYWECSACHKKYSDEAHTAEVTDVSVARLGHAFADGFCTRCGKADHVLYEGENFIASVDGVNNGELDTIDGYLADNLYRYVALGTGTITIAASGDGDSNGILTNSDKSAVLTYDYDGNNKNSEKDFKLTYSVTAGETYYIGIRSYYHNTALTNYTITVTCDWGVTLSYSATQFGSVSVKNGDTAVASGATFEAADETQVTATATADEGCKFVKWTDRYGAQISTDATIVLTMTESKHVRAVFECQHTDTHVVHHPAVAATCTATGTIEYWECSKCGKKWSDEARTTEVEDLATEALGHDFVDGLCTRCGKADHVLYEGENFLATVSGVNNYFSRDLIKAYPNDNLFKYVAMGTGTVTIAASAIGDSYGILTDRDRSTVLVYDNNSNGNLDFKFTYSVTKGETYYVGIRSDSYGDALYNCTVTITGDWAPSLTYETTTYGSAIVKNGDATVESGANFVAADQTQLSATATADDGCRFVRWIGQYGEWISTDATIVLTMSESKYIKAVFECLHTDSHLIHHPAAEASCYTAANIEYWECSVCGKKWSDEACTTEVTNIFEGNALGHEYVDGFCTRCGKEKRVLFEGRNSIASVAGVNNFEYFSVSGYETDNLYRYVALGTGTVTIAASGGGDSYGVLMNGDKSKILVEDDQSNGNNDFKFTYTVTAGETYYVGIRSVYSNRALTNYTVTITGNWRPTLTYEATEGGSVDVKDGDTTVTSGTTFEAADKTLVTATATTYEEYRFISWTDQYGEWLSTDASIDLTMTKSMYIKAVFECLHAESHIVHHPTAVATCKAAGTIEYWECSKCGKKWSDENLTNEVTDVVTDDKLPHDYVDGICTFCDKVDHVLYEGVNSIASVAGVNNSDTYKPSGYETDNLYKYVALGTGAVTIAASGDGDSYGVLINSDKSNVLKSNDDGNGNRDFKFTYTVKAGETYYVGIRSVYSNRALTNYTITITGDWAPGLTYEATEGGSVDVKNGDTTVESGTTFVAAEQTQVTATAIVDGGFKFVRWIGQYGEWISTDATIVLTMSESKYIKAVFEEVEGTATSVGTINIRHHSHAKKYLENGRIVIEKDGMKWDVMGRKL